VIHILKLIFVVIDGMADLPIAELGNRTPLEAAETPNMNFLARIGKTGLMYTVRKGVAPESDVAVISILGYDPSKYGTGRGVLEAVGADVAFSNGNLALRCNFATLGRGNEIVDRRAGRDLTTEEAAELSRTVNERVRLESCAADFEFRNTLGHRAVLVIRSREKSLSSMITNTDPAYTRVEELSVAEPNVAMLLRECKPTDNTEKARISARLVNEFVAKSRDVLSEHEVNQRRVARGKLKANGILTRDAGHQLPKFFNINKMYNVHFASLTDMPVERGISKLTGMHLTALPPPSSNLKEDCMMRAEKLLDILSSYDCVYIHIKGPDEPGHDGDFKLKKHLISVIDTHFLGTILREANLRDHVICVTADHATPCALKAHSDDPVPLLIAGNKISGDNVSKFSEKECMKGSLGTLEHGTELMPRLIKLLKE
jgi:2,3-bisphosphoglycerate-independent phosphoglycerate mutase